MSLKLQDLNTTLINCANVETLRDYLEILVDALDKLDEDDYFGTQGWRYFLD